MPRVLLAIGYAIMAVAAVVVIMGFVNPSQVLLIFVGLVVGIVGAIIGKVGRKLQRNSHRSTPRESPRV